jgi:hypothetical protein
MGPKSRKQRSEKQKLGKQKAEMNQTREKQKSGK